MLILGLDYSCWISLYFLTPSPHPPTLHYQRCLQFVKQYAQWHVKLLHIILVHHNDAWAFCFVKKKKKSTGVYHVHLYSHRLSSRWAGQDLASRVHLAVGQALPLGSCPACPQPKAGQTRRAASRSPSPVHRAPPWGQGWALTSCMIPTFLP